LAPDHETRPSSPRVTVVIPNWNGERFLEVCLGSLRAQAFRDFETVLVDNGSSDGSIALVGRTSRRSGWCACPRTWASPQR
jgi:GT2 family glycosyltransferase